MLKSSNDLFLQFRHFWTYLSREKNSHSKRRDIICYKLYKQLNTCIPKNSSIVIWNSPIFSSTMTCKSKWVILVKPPNFNLQMKRESVFVEHWIILHLKSYQDLSVIHMKWISGPLESSVMQCYLESLLSNQKINNKH